MHCLGQVIYFYFCGYAKFLEYTLGIRLGHFRYGYSRLGASVRGLPRASWGEEVSSPRVGRYYSESTRSTPSPSPLYAFHVYVRGVAFATKLL